MNFSPNNLSAYRKIVNKFEIEIQCGFRMWSRQAFDELAAIIISRRYRSEQAHARRELVAKSPRRAQNIANVNKHLTSWVHLGKTCEIFVTIVEELDGTAVGALRRAIAKD
jgi:hypothetical protein